MAYISEKIRDQVRMQHFRDALTGARKKTAPEETLKDHGVTEPVTASDIQDLGQMFRGEVRQQIREEEAMLTGQPVIQDEQDELENPQSGFLARVLAGVRSERASRVQAVISLSSTGVSYETPEQPAKQHVVSLAFHTKAVDPANNADPAKRDVNAVRMIMENVFDWDFHERHHGDTVTPQLVYRLMKSLKLNLETACPSVKNDRVLELFDELAAHDWVGDIVNFRHMTEHVIEAYLEAQNGNPKPIEKMERFLQGAIRFHERFYAELPEAKVPMRTLAQALEKQAGRPSSAKLRPA